MKATEYPADLSSVAAFNGADQCTLAGADGVHLAVYTTQHVGETRVFFSHATGFCGTSWAAVADELHSMPWTAWDFRGHGRSGGGTIPTSWWMMGADAGAVRDATPTERAVGVGHSMGGAALLMAQLVDSHRFEALVLFEPIVFPGPFRRVPEVPLATMARKRRAEFDSREAAFANYRHKPPFDTWDERALNGYLATGLRDVEGGVELACSPDYEAEVFTASAATGLLDRLGEIEIPVVVIADADADSYPDPEWPESLADALPQGRAMLIDAGGHFAPMDRPEAIAEAVLQVAG